MNTAHGTTGTPVTPEVEKALDEFSRQLQRDLGDQLITLAIYGGVARGEFLPQTSDVNGLLVLKSATPEVLDRLQPAVELARRTIRLTLLTLTEEDLADAAEVFPVKFLDIQRHHRVLFGSDLTGRLQVPRDRLRRQCARELMNLRLRLRQAYLDHPRQPEQLESALRRGVSTLFINLAVLLELKTGRALAGRTEIVEAATALGLDSGQLGRCLDFRRGHLKPGPAELKQAYGDFMRLVHQTLGALEPIGT